MRTRSYVVSAAVIAALPSFASAHYSQRVWADVDNAGTLRSVVGPPGNAPFAYSQSMFFYSRVYARDLGNQDDVNYSSLLGGQLFSDLDSDDDGVTYESDFPGYEDTPFPTKPFTGTYSVALVGAPLYYVPAGGNSPAKFVPVSTAYAGQPLPYFSISNTYVDSSGNDEVAYMDTNGNGAPVPAFTVGSHGHPDLVLHPNPEDDDYDGPGDPVMDSDQYDGIYAVPMQLVGPAGVASSLTYYEVCGKNEPLAEIAQAGILAEDTLVVPISSSWSLTTGGSWGSAGSWSGTMPFDTGDTATFGTNPGAASAITVTLDGDYSVGHLVFNSSSTSYTITPGSSGFLSMGANNSADITVLAGSHTIAVPVAFAVSLNVNTAAGTAITLINSLSFPPTSSYPYATSLTKTGSGTLTLSGAISTGYASTFTATGGTTVFSTDPTAGLSIVASGVDTVVELTAATGGGYQSRNAASLNLSSGARVTLQSPVHHANRTVLDLGGLSLDSTSALDLGTNDLVIQNANSNAAKATLAGLTSWLKQGYNGGGWNGSGGIVSTAAAGNYAHLTAIGAIVNDNGSGSAIYPNFDGTADANPDTDVLLKYTYYGDANLDGQVDGSDYSLIDNGFLNHLTGWANGDFNYDGVVDGSDYTLIDNAFNTQVVSLGNGSTTATVAEPTARTAAVPEPTAAALVPLIGGVFSCRRRTRKSKHLSAGGEEETHELK